MRPLVCSLVLMGTLLASSESTAWPMTTADTWRAGQEAREQPAGAGTFPGKLPASFAGDLPCADCPGVRHTVELHPDRVFVYRMAYAGRGEERKGEEIDNLGRWSVSADGRVLTLRGGREAVVIFEVIDARTLRKLDSRGRPIESALNYTLTRATIFEPLQPSLALRGMYSYLADAGVFVECQTGWRVPVAAEGDNASLERGYQAARTEAGEPVLVTLEGQLAWRPKMEGVGHQRLIVPSRFIKAWPGGTCQSAEEGAGVTPMAGTGWRFVSSTLNVPAPQDVSRITLTFTDRRLSAASGCNTGSAAFTTAGGRLVAPIFATTKRACLGPLEQWEPAYFRFLSSKPALKREADDLVLTSAEGEMRFRSMPVPSDNAVRKFIYVASERKPCADLAPTSCLQIRETETDTWQLYFGEILGFTHRTGIEYRLRILEDNAPDPSADGSSKRWFLDFVVEQRVVKR